MRQDTRIEPRTSLIIMWHPCERSRTSTAESIDVQEYRNGSTGTKFSNQMASVGLPAIVLIFHPLLIWDFRYEVRRLEPGAWQLRLAGVFQPEKDKESRIRRYRMAGHVYPIALRMWSLD